MPTRVLAFESDTQFARELETEFRKLGCEVTVVDDVNSGLQAASANKPDLILLTIELPRMSGYSVCNRIKRDADLKEIPLIIMSSESTDQTFEQHRRLGTRAQDYVRKPVSFPDLLERVRKFVNLSQSASLMPEDDDILIDDEVELVEDGERSVRPASRSVSPSLRPIDADIDDFAEHAFGAIVDESVPPSVAPAVPSAIPPASRGSVKPARRSQRAAASQDAEQSDEDLRRITLQLEEKDRLLADALGEVRELKRASRVSQGDSEETENLKREVRDLKLKLAAPTPSSRPSVAPNAREFLDLREQLNKKDKELLDLRDQLTHKDKELLNLRDLTLSHERDKADLSDKVGELERQLADLQKIADAARNDKEAAAKRAEDFKRKAEKVAGQLEDKTTELARVGAKHAAELTEKESELTRILAEHTAALELARSEYVRAISEAEQESKTTLEQALAESRSTAEQHERQALDNERQSAIEQRDAALSELEQRLRTELAADKAAALEQLRAEKESNERTLEGRLEVLQRDLDLRNTELNQANQTIQQRDESVASLDASLRTARGDLEQAGRTAVMRDERITTLEAELAQQRNETLVTLESLSDERRRLATVLDKWNEDQANLEHVKDALAAALIQVEAIEARTIE
jgi:DNA-binding response OmpR family regulator/chromosome segregation ATPase